MHGIRTSPNSIIISQEDYISLFRPNQYRQQKLSLSIKESTTLIIGYGLGDVKCFNSSILDKTYILMQKTLTILMTLFNFFILKIQKNYHIEIGMIY